MMKIYLPTKLFKKLSLVFSFLLFAFWANATTYYLTAAGAGSAQTPGSWNTNPAGGGTAAANFTTDGDVFIIPIGINGTLGANITIGSNNSSGSGVSLQINGTLAINSGIILSLDGKNTNQSTITVNGTINFLGTGQVSLLQNNSGMIFTLSSGATLKTQNTLGIVNTLSGYSILKTANAVVNLNVGANYEFSGAASQATLGLPATVNTLTINNSVGVSLTAAVAVTTSLTIGNVTANSILNDNGKQITSTGTFNLTSGTFNIGVNGAGGGTSYPAFTVSNINQATTVNYNSNQPQIIAAVNYGNLKNTNNGNRTLASLGTIGISGTFTPGGGTYTVGTSTVSFNGTAAQVIPAVSFSFYNLKIDNTAGISSIGGNTTVTNSLALTNGVVTTGGNKIIIPSGASVAKTNGWVNGNLQKYISTTSPVVFEIGDAGNYSPVTVNFALITTPGNLTATVTQGLHPAIASSGLNSAKTVTRYWNLISGGLAGTYDATFGFVAGDVPGGSVPANFVVRNYNNPNWAITINGIRTGTTTQTTGLTTFGDFAIGEYSGVPTVSAQPANTAVCFGNNASFTSASTSTPAPTVEWQRSTDGVVWVNIISTTDGGKYTNFTTNTLNISAPDAAMDGYQYRSVYTNINGTVNSNVVTLTVTQSPTVTLLDYATSPFANITATPQSVTLTGTNAYTGGTFTSDAGLTINSTTGDITPNTSTLGNHTVTYTIAAAGGCGQVTATTVINITTAPTANISFVKDSFCISDNSTYTATLTGTGDYNNGGAGFYSVNPTSGLLINTTNGDITPDGIAGTYIVTYHIPASGGFPASTSDKEVVITPTPTAAISYSGGPFCTSDQTAQTVTLTGTNAYTGGIFSATPAGLVLDANNGEFTPNGSTGNTTYTVTYTIPASGGCAAVPVTATAFDVVTRPTASISYAGTPYCQAFTTPQAVTITGASGGTFSSSPAGLTINASTGAITPSSSIAGDYDVVYEIPATGPCGVVQITTTVSIVETPTGTISYPLQPYCTADPLKPVTLTGTGNYAGGTFTSAAGLSINNSTGTINPVATTPNTYTVTYTTPGCPVDFQTVVEVNGSPTATISYVGTPFCQTDGSSKAVSLTGDNTGTFSAPGGLSIDPTFGDITPSTSTAGTYLVTYTIPGSGNCSPVVKTTSVTITAAVGVPTAITIGSGTEPACQLTNGTTTTTYTTTATDATGFNWSLSNPAAGSISSAGVMTWANGFSGTVDIQVTANGCNGLSAQVIRTVNINPTVLAPVFTLGATSTRCQGAGTVMYDAAATNTTGITYSIDATSAGAGNTIVSTTGDVTFAAGWSGTSVITASAAGCNGPATATHTVTITPTVGTPVFTLGATSTRCQDAGNVTYAATATNNTGITYSLDATSAGAGNTIVSTTGEVTFVAGWSGTSVITASAEGCNGPKTADHTVTINPTVTIAAFSPATSVRCQGAGTALAVTTTATNNTAAIVYSLDNASTLAGNSIASATGVVTYVAGWSGNTTITASAAGCNGPASTAHVVTINAATVGGSISPALIPVCSGGTPTLTLSGHTGSVVRWEQSINAGSSWAPIANTNATYTTPALTQATLFRAVVQNGTGVCAEANSAPAQVIIDAPFTPSITAVTNDSVCLGGTIILTASSYTSSGLVVSGGDFAASNPPGWNGSSANNNNGDNNSDWGIANLSTFNGVTYKSSADNDKYMIATGTTDFPDKLSDLTTPAFSLVGLPSAYLALNQAYNLLTGAQAEIRISIDGGTTYTSLRTYTGSASPGTTYGPTIGLHATEYIDLSPYLGMTNLKLQFLYTGSVGSNWAIDNIVVTNSTANPTGVNVYNNVTYTWAPAANLSATSGQSVTFNSVTSGIGSFPYTVTTTTSAAGCSGAAPGTITVVVNPVTVAGTLPASVSVCTAGNNTINLTGNTGSVMQWESSINGGTTWTPIANTTTSLTFPVAAVTTLYRAVVQSGVCPLAYSTVTRAGLHDVWTGKVDTDWQKPANWSDSLLPSTSCPTVLVPNVTNKPILSNGTSTIINLDIQSSSLTINGTGLLQIAGTISNTGTFNVANGSLDFNGTSAQNPAGQSIAGSLFVGNDIKNLTVSNTTATGLSLTGGVPLNILGDLSFGATNATVTTNDNLVLRSTATSTARVADITSNGTITNAYTGNKFVGKVTVERFYPGNRAWRLITAPLSNTGNILNSWQAGGSASAYVVGKGMFVTGLNPTLAAGNGLDTSYQNNYSMKGWNADTGYANVTNTKTQLLSTNASSAANIGYFTFVRGDRRRSPDNTIVPYTNNTTLSSKGNLQTGTQTFAAAGLQDQFTLIGNPYASPVDFNKISLSNVPKRFIVWDPLLNDVGGFVVLDDVDNNNVYAPYTSPGGQDNNLQSSQAFFVQTLADGVASVAFNESDKTPVNKLGLFRPLTEPLHKDIQVTLYKFKPDNTAYVADGTYAEFDDQYKPGVTFEDALKFTNINETFGLIRNSKMLAIERRPTIKITDTLFLKLTRTTRRNYRMEFKAGNLDQDNLAGFVEDKYLNQLTPINLNGNTTVDFTITADAPSAAADRFKVIFKPSVIYTGITAKMLDKDIAVNWTLPGEYDIREYEIERSTDGVSFTRIATKAAAGNSNSPVSYQWLDKEPAPGDYYYRIRSISYNSITGYSNAVKVRMNKATPAMYVFPNPVTQNFIQLQMNSMPQGLYSVRLINSLGQVVVNKQISHGPGTAVEKIQPATKLLPGTYHLEIGSPGKKISMIKVNVQ